MVTCSFISQKEHIMSASRPSSFEPLLLSKTPVIWSLKRSLLSQLRFYARPAAFVIAVASCAVLMMKAPEASGSSLQDAKMLNENVRLLAQSVEILRDGLVVFKTGLEQSSYNHQARFAALDERLVRAEAAERVSAQNLEVLNTKLETISQTQAALVQLEQKITHLQTQVLASKPNDMAPVAAILPPARPSAMALARAPHPTDQWRVVGMEDGFAIIESAHGLMEVQAGNIIPGIGRVEAVTRKGREWIVVTRRGVIGSQGHFASRQPVSIWSKQVR
jgi:hypothetical protein